MSVYCGVLRRYIDGLLKVLQRIIPVPGSSVGDGELGVDLCIVWLQVIRTRTVLDGCRVVFLFALK